MKKLLHWFRGLPYRFQGGIVGISIPFLCLFLFYFFDISIFGLIAAPLRLQVGFLFGETMDLQA